MGNGDRPPLLFVLGACMLGLMSIVGTVCVAVLAYHEIAPPPVLVGFTSSALGALIGVMAGAQVQPRKE